MLKKIKLWWAQFMMNYLQGSVYGLARLIDWDKDILSRTQWEQILVMSYREAKKWHRKWSARYCNLLFEDEDWYTPIKERALHRALLLYFKEVSK